MRPIRLKLEAFGPYVDELEIDFERELGGENFFLIHGVTGSGKTSLLDAICFALYGDSSGGGRDGTMMRSEQADANHQTYVEFTFALRDKIYRVRRTPRYERAKARGTGTTTVNADAELYRIEGGLNVLMTNGASKVTTMISELIGFKCDQFRQVIVLPQGDFKRFLMAGSKDRESILTILFKTGFYRRLEDQLKQRAAEMKRLYESKLSERAIHLSETDAKDEAELSALISKLDGELKAATDGLNQLKTDRDALNKKHSEAQALAQKFIDLDRRNDELKGASADLDRVRREIEPARAEYDRRKAEEPERRSMDQRIVELTKVIRKLEELKYAIRRAGDASKAVKKAQTDLSTVKIKVEKFERRLQQLLDEEKTHIVGAGKVEEYQRRLADCKQRDQLVDTIRRLENDFKQSKATLDRIERQRLDRQRDLDRLKHLSRTGRAALLAIGLREGEPCPVCGSTHHPRLATSDDLIPTDEEIETAERQLKSIEMQKLEADKKLSGQRAELESKREELSSKSKLISTEQAQTELDAARQSAATLDDCRQRIAKGRQFVDDVRREREENQRALTEAAAREASARRSVEEKQQTIMEGYGASDEARVSVELRELRSALDEKKRAFDAADKNFHRLERELATAIAKHQSIIDARTELTDQLKDRERPNVDQLRAELERAEASFVDGTKLVTRLTERLNVLRDKGEKLSALATERDRLEREHRTWSRLSTVANGNVSFSRYVLHAMFEDIIAEANQRLAVMSGRRYMFIDRKESLGARRLSGLELEIYDEYSESTRNVQTLSGGESFLASLALALGLADVVQNYAGGVKLDTIFIDEGFGTLDSETLDMAIRSLMDLQSGGRLVGIISHVEELKQRIPVRLEVSKTRKGSRASFRRQ